ncbi:MAG: hypothetical protein ACREI8_05590 [Myxococcota bacterium]
MPARSGSPERPIATLNEGPLHAALKAWYARNGDRLEVPVEGRQIDIVRGDLLIEIQTSNLAALRRKLETLIEDHPVRLVHPVALEKWILRIDGDTQRVLGRRRSPRRGKLEDAFKELVSLAKLLAHPDFSCEILLTREEEVRINEPGRAWRRHGWVIVERRLIDVVDTHLFCDRSDLRRILPPDLPARFTTADLADALRIASNLAQKMAYCLREAGAIAVEGKRGNARTYRVTGWGA